MAVLASDAGHLFPVNEGKVTRRERSLTWARIFPLAWPATTLPPTVAPPRDEPAGW